MMRLWLSRVWTSSRSCSWRLLHDEFLTHMHALGRPDAQSTNTLQHFYRTLQLDCKYFRRVKIPRKEHTPAQKYCLPTKAARYAYHHFAWSSVFFVGKAVIHNVCEPHVCGPAWARRSAKRSRSCCLAESWPTSLERDFEGPTMFFSYLKALPCWVAELWQAGWFCSVWCHLCVLAETTMERTKKGMKRHGKHQYLHAHLYALGYFRCLVHHVLFRILRWAM